jgi:ABC-type lipoprotein export system ATPase subunit
LKISLNGIEVNLPDTGQTLFRLKQFSIESGQKVLLRGESGKGKTTLLHLIAGLFQPAAGDVEVGGQKISTWSDEARCAFRRRNMVMVFQKLNLIEHLTALENVGLACSVEQRSADALAAVGLEKQIHARSSVLSLGEQQRVAVARVLASDAKVILADEPTSSLDEKNAANVMDLLFKAAQHKTLLVVSHDHRIEKKFDSNIQFETVAHR